MAYRKDVDLEFFSKISSSDLEPLVQLLTHDPKDGSVRLTEELTYNEMYKRFAPDHSKYWDLVAGELQCFGGNTLATIFRGGKGVLYKEILIDVCKNQKVNFNKKSGIREIENQFLGKILEKSWDKMSEREKKIFLRRCKISPVYFILGITRVLSFDGIIIQLTSPAYRVTIPACALVAVLRKKYEPSPEEILIIKKENDLINKLAQMVRNYQQSDKKMLGFYLAAISTIQEIGSDLTKEDIEAVIFGTNRDSLERVEELLKKISLPPNWEASVKYAIATCECDKNHTRSTLELIMEWADFDENQKSRLFQRYDEIVNQL